MYIDLNKEVTLRISSAGNNGKRALEASGGENQRLQDVRRGEREQDLGAKCCKTRHVEPRCVEPRESAG